MRQLLTVYKKKIPHVGVTLVAIVVSVVGIHTLTTSHAATTRDPAIWPFASDSPWNMPLGSGATFASASDLRTVDLMKYTPWINAGQYSHPICQASLSDPLAHVNDTSYSPRSADYRIPANCPIAAGTDMHMHVIDPTKHYVDECWDTTRISSSSYNCGYHVRNDLYGPGVGQGGVRAYGGSAIGGLMRTSEVVSENIPHVLALTIDGHQFKRGPVWPATAEDGNASTNYLGNIPMGALVAIPPSVNIAGLGLSASGNALATTLQNYGAYIVDQTYGCTCLAAEPSAENTSQLAGMRNDWGAIRSQLRPVTNNSANNVGGGGTRRAPLAPALDGSIASVPPTPPAAQIDQTNNLATGKALITSDTAVTGFSPPSINDKDESTRWISSPTDGVTLSTDLLSNYTISKISILWAADTTKDYQIQISADNKSWTTIATGATNNSATQLITVTNFTTTALGRYVRVVALDRWNSSYGNSIYEIGIYGTKQTDVIPPPSTSVGDINNDGHINALDLSLLISHDGQNYSPADFNKDGTVGAADLAVLLSHWTW
jgi:hypothetical protein